ncbi:galanin receptor type 2-like [Schistocerca nitens]|uniref:galanin receptor type 2-like n=1 Tax=Schistocerca nitens TaxID=7011 RepID=UPI002119319D|nr:galanin receptor type 2-like [Schistocerca nitens]
MADDFDCTTDALSRATRDSNSSTVNTISEAETQCVLNTWFQQQFTYHEPQHILLIACYVPLFLLAAIANTLVIIVVVKYHYMRSVTNYFLVNLSAADLLVTLICMPMAVSGSVSKLWLYGSVMCKLTHYIQGVAVGASVFTITAMSIDRYLAIRHPMAFRKIFNRRTTIAVIVVLWLAALAIFSPLLRAYSLAEVASGYAFCYESWHDSERRGASLAFFVLVYAVPGSIVVMAYSLMGRRLCAISPPFSEDSMASTKQGRSVVRERRRVARILLLLAVLFALCWLPYNALSLATDMLGGQAGAPLRTALRFTLLLGHANSAVNPVLYCFLTRTFRSAARELIVSRNSLLASRHHQRHKVSCYNAKAALYDWQQKGTRYEGEPGNLQKAVVLVVVAVVVVAGAAR